VTQQHPKRILWLRGDHMQPKGSYPRRFRLGQGAKTAGAGIDAGLEVHARVSRRDENHAIDQRRRPADRDQTNIHRTKV